MRFVQSGAVRTAGNDQAGGKSESQKPQETQKRIGKEFHVPSKKMKNQKVFKFLEESNAIEGVYGSLALHSSVAAWQRINRVRPALSLSDLLDIHSALIGPLDPKIAGRLRSVNIRVDMWHGPDYDKVHDLLIDWLEKWKHPKTWAQIKQAHIEFEQIHPFQDGNGRIGRIIMNWQRIRAGLPIMIILAAKKSQYYEWFKEK